jgi:hypothetical protein
MAQNIALLDKALQQEGVTGRAADFVKSLYQQESSSGENTRTSNAGAVGGMQIIPTTFSSVADAGWDINNPEHNVRAGIRYANQMFDKAGGDAKLAAAGYYGGDGGLNKARKGKAVSDPRNPHAPNTLEYGDEVASRMGDGEKVVGLLSDMGGDMNAKSSSKPAAKPKGDRVIGLYSELYPQDKPAVPTIVEAKKSATTGDYAKQFGASALDALESIGKGGAEFAAKGLNKLTGTDDYYVKEQGPAGSMADQVRNSMTPAGIEASQTGDVISGDVFNPKTWEVTGNKEQLAMFGLQALGSLATWIVPGAAALRAPKIAGAVSGTVGALSTAGDQAGDARTNAETYVSERNHEQLMQEIPHYAEVFNKTHNEEYARQAVVNDAGFLAAALSAPLGAIEGTVIGKMLPGLPKIPGIGDIANPVARRLAGAGGGAVVEGAQEAAEKSLGNMGENLATGRTATDDVTRNTLPEALGGGFVGGGIGGLSASKSRGQRIIDELKRRQQPTEQSSVQQDAVDISDIIGSDEQPNQDIAMGGMLPNRDLDPMIVFEDGSTGKQSEFDAYINSLPTDAEKMAARAKLMGYGQQPADPVGVEEQSSAGQLPNRDLDPLVVFKDGSTGRRSEVEGYINSLPENEQIPARAKLLGYGEQDVSITDPAAAAEVVGETIAQGVDQQQGSDGVAIPQSDVDGLDNSTAAPGTSDAANIQAGTSAAVEAGAVPALNTLDDVAHQAATSQNNDLPEPTQAQKEAGNYKLGHIKLGGMDISIENPDGSARKGVDREGKSWESTMHGHYGYVKGKGVVARAPDKEHVDVNIKSGTAEDFDGDVFVINQNDPQTGKFDEPKVYIGYGSENEAEGAYRSNYADNWQGFGDVVRVPMAKFKDMLGNKRAFLKPIKSVVPKTQGEQSELETGRIDTQTDIGADEGTAATAETGNQELQSASVDTASTTLTDGPDGTEREGVRGIVNAIVLRRAAAEQIRKQKDFDSYLGAAKDFLNGKDIKPSRFKMAAAAFKDDQVLSDSFTKLAELAKAPAKQARANITDAIEQFKQRIDQAGTVEEIRKITGEIQQSGLTDAKVEELDDLAMDRMDALITDEGEAESSNSQEPEANEQAAEEVKPPVVSKPNQEKIDDLGEKIGGARKDTAIKGDAKPKRAANDDDRPTWAKRYKIREIISSTREGDVGKFAIYDSRDKDRLGNMRQMGNRALYDTREEAEAALPVLVVGVKHSVYPTAEREDGTRGHQILRNVNDRKRVKVVDTVFESRMEALQYMVEHAVEIIETNTTFGELDLPTPDTTNRVGVQRRAGDVQGKDFMDSFGFRGVEFGNWNNQIERQQLMNAAYDGLMDLADVLNIPARAISLNGDLALAFGARGQGLSAAKAHYESGKAVINLTKMNGAGSLAHEWLHALDHYLARLDGKAPNTWQTDEDGTKSLKAARSTEHAFASHGFQYQSNAREELRNAYKNLVQTIFTKAETYVEDATKADEFVARARENMADRLDRLRADISKPRESTFYKRNNKAASAEQLAEFDTVAKQLLDGQGLDAEYRVDPGARSIRKIISGHYTNDALDKISTIYKAVRGRSGFDSTNRRGVMDYLRDDMSRYSQRLKLLAQAQAGDTKVKRLPTNFAMNAKELDQGRGTDYWTTPHEMAARAFQGYVEDKVAEKGGKSPFLNYGPENRGILTPWGVKFPFPRGEERQAINKALDSFVAVLETKETENGNVALFKSALDLDALNASEQSYVNPLLVDDIKDAIDKDTYGHDVDIYATVMDAPVYIQNQIYRERLFGAMGFFDSRTNKVALIAENIASLEQAREVARHELIGHYGIENMLNDTDPELLPKLLKAVNVTRKLGNNAVINDAAKHVLKEQHALRVLPSDTADVRARKEKRIAKEIIAVMAERNVQNSIMKRVYDAIRSFLKKLGFLKNSDTTDAEIARLLRNAQRYLKGKSLKQDAFNGDLVASFAGSHNIEQIKLSSVFYAREAFSGKTFKNKSDGKEIIVGNQGIKHAMSGKVSEISAIALSKLDEILTKAQYVRSEPDKAGRNTIKEVRFYQVPVSFNGENSLLEVVVRVASDGSRYYDHFEVKNPAGQSGKPDNQDSNQPFTGLVSLDDAPIFSQNQGDVNFTASQVNTPAFKRWFGDSKVVDRNGQPLTVYHGTNSDFEKFSSEFIGDGNGNSDWGDGFYFADKSDVANSYADNDGANVMPVYLSIKNPADSTVMMSDEVQLAMDDGMGFTTVQEVLEDMGYDGIAIQHKEGMEYIVFNPNQIKSATGNNGNFDANDERVSFSGRQEPLGDQWQNLEESKFATDMVYTFQDKHKDLKDVIKAIRATGRVVSDRINAYLQEELFHGRVAKRIEDFTKGELEPLLNDMNTAGVSMADFEHYLWARHAEERNIQMAKINPDDPDMQDGGSGLTTAEAKAYIAQIPTSRRATFERLANLVDAINKRSRDLLVQYGLEDVDVTSKMESAYKHYVPLMRDEMEKGFGSGTGQGFSIRGNSTKRAMGSEKPVVDILANIAAQREKFIVRGEKNRVSTALVGLASMNPNKDFWKVDKPPVIRQVSKATGLVEEMTDPNYKSKNNVIVARVVDSSGRVQERSVIFNEFDKRAMRMSESLKNLDVDGMEDWLGTIATATRYFASVNTQYNPLFGVVNIVRDVQSAVINLGSTDLARDKKAVLSNIGQAWIGIYRDLRAARKGERVAGQWSDLWDEYQDVGGQTGYRELFRTSKDRTDTLNKIVDPDWWKSKRWGKIVSLNNEHIANAEALAADKVGKPIFQWLDDYNASLENATRLAAYKVAVDKGMSKQQAASLAKNLTVNFNRKGASGSRMGALYAFFNASVQGTARMYDTMFRDGKLSATGRRIVYGGVLLGILQALALAGFDDNEPPQFERDRNLILPIGDGKYIKMPMPLGFHVIPSSARVITEFMLNGGENKAELIAHLAELYADSFNPVGGSGSLAQILSPTVTDPIVDLTINKDFAGRTIAQKDFNSLDPTPGFKRARDTASSVSTVLSEMFNRVTGGTDYQPGLFSPTPDQIDYLVGQLFGGVGREILKVDTAARSVMEGTELPSYKIPLAGKFYGDTVSQSSEGRKFYSNIEKMNGHEREIKGRTQDKREIASYTAKYPEAALWRQANLIDRTVKKLRDRRQRLIDNGAPKADVQEIDATITERMRTLNELIESAKK